MPIAMTSSPTPSVDELTIVNGLNSEAGAPEETETTAKSEYASVPRTVAEYPCPFEKVMLKLFKLRSYHCRVCKWEGRVFLYKVRNNFRKVLVNYALLIIGLLIFLLIMNLILKK